MYEFGIPSKLIRLTELRIKTIKNGVKILHDVSETFVTQKGLKQGDGLLLCLLFNFAREKAIRNSQMNIKGTIHNKSIQILAYADDIDIVGRSISAVKEAILALSKAVQNIGLVVNMGGSPGDVSEVPVT